MHKLEFNVSYRSNIVFCFLIQCQLKQKKTKNGLICDIFVMLTANI